MAVKTKKSDRFVTRFLPLKQRKPKESILLKHKQISWKKFLIPSGQILKISEVKYTLSIFDHLIEFR
jgi:hypothetical protein